MTKPSLPKLMTELQELAAQPVYRDRVVDVALALANVEPANGLLVVWNELWGRAAPWAPRVAAFTMARCAEQAGDAIWPVASSYLSSPAITDESTLFNVVSALQLSDTSSALAKAVLQVDLYGFLYRCASGTVPVVDAIADLLVRLHDVGTLKDVLSRPQAESIRERLGQRSQSAERTVDLAECLASTAFRAAVDFRPSTIDAARRAVSAPIGSSSWHSAVRAAGLAAQARLDDVRCAWELQQDPAREVGTLQQLRLVGAKAEAGKLPLLTLEGVLRGWHKLFQSAFAAINKRVPGAEAGPAEVLALAPQAGSFVVRLVVIHDGREETARAAFEESARLAEGRATLTHLEREPDAVQGVAHLHGVLSSAELDLTLDSADRGGSQARSRISRQISARVLGETKTATTDETEQEILGVLEGANHRSGKVEIGLIDESGTVACDTPGSARHLLVNKVIGKQYRFLLNRVISRRGLGDEAKRWTLLGVQAFEPAVQEPTAQAVPAWSVTDPVSSDHIPQQDNLERIWQLVRVLASGQAPTPGNMGMKADTDQERSNSERHIDYMKHGAKVLGLMTESGTLLPTGQVLAMLNWDKALSLMAIQFQASFVGRAWLHWAGVAEVEDLDPESSEAFLMARGVRGAGKHEGEPLSQSMIERRGRTLRRWAREFRAVADESA